MAKKTKKRPKAKSQKEISKTKIEILAGYVRDLHKSGYTNDEIKASLKRNGASPALISAAMRTAKSGKSIRPRLPTLKPKKIPKKKPAKKKPLFKKKKKIIKEVKKKKAAKFKVIQPKTKKTFKKRKLKPFILFMIIFLIIIAAVGVLAMPKNCGQDLACFVEKANKCDGAKYFANIDNAEVKFTTHGCSIEKKIIEVSRDEPKDVRNIFTGMAMVCKYERGQFSTQYTDGISGGIDTCSGELANVIDKLTTVKEISG
ncbi:hypothetical protein KY335_03260 [Candidatus Woesearchaeota archaeon]|nr:hypothetical protein [Candidatus Woesearchaeota archaeon]